MTRHEEAGFTLIEMLVALAIFSLAALALLRLDGFTVRSTADLADRSIARLVVQNEAALLASAPSAPAEGSSARTVENHGARFLVMTEVRAMPGTDDRVAIVIVARPEAGGSNAQLTLVRRKA